MEKCKFCGMEIGEDAAKGSYRQKYCDGVQTWGPDPFQEEIRGDSTDYLMCSGERLNSAWEI